MNIYETIINLRNRGQEAVLITVVRKEGHGPQVPGAKLLVCKDKEKIGTIGGGALEHIAIEEAIDILKRKENILKSYNLDEDNNLVKNINTGMICGGTIDLFYEYLGSNENVIIFGAGHVGKALAYYLTPLNYNIKLYDTREEVLSKVEATNNKHIIESYSSIPFDDIPTNSYMIIMTHSHALDYIALKAIYESKIKPKYLGMIASKKKSAKMLKQLCSELNYKPDFSYLYTPVGLKLGGSSPEEIALSIAAELQVIKYKHENHPHLRGC